MKKTIQTLRCFDQYGNNTPEFLAFARTFKSEFKKQLESVGCKLHKFSVGHFYFSGFFTKGDNMYYFSWHNGDKQLMYRTANHDRDFTGGCNQWVRISEDLGYQLILH